jgi:hypothetical protein
MTWELGVIVSVQNVAKKIYITEGYRARMKDAQTVGQKCLEKTLIITSSSRRSIKINNEEPTVQPGEKIDLKQKYEPY